MIVKHYTKPNILYGKHYSKPNILYGGSIWKQLFDFGKRIFMPFIPALKKTAISTGEKLLEEGGKKLSETVTKKLFAPETSQVIEQAKPVSDTLGIDLQAVRREIDKIQKRESRRGVSRLKELRKQYIGDGHCGKGLRPLGGGGHKHKKIMNYM